MKKNGNKGGLGSAAEGGGEGMSRIITWDEINPGMTVYLEIKPKYGYPPHENPDFNLEPHRITERLENGQLRFETETIRPVVYGRLKPGRTAKVRYWTDGHPTLEERKAVPWPEEVSRDADNAN